MYTKIVVNAMGQEEAINYVQYIWNIEVWNGNVYAQSYEVER